MSFSWRKNLSLQQPFYESFLSSVFIPSFFLTGSYNEGVEGSPRLDHETGYRGFRDPVRILLRISPRVDKGRWQHYRHPIVDTGHFTCAVSRKNCEGGVGEIAVRFCSVQTSEPCDRRPAGLDDVAGLICLWSEMRSLSTLNPAPISGTRCSR